MSKTVMVLGGGIGGVVVASRLRKLLGHEHRVVLVEREADHLFQPSLLWLMLGWGRPEQIMRPIARLARRGIEVVRGNVERIDPARRAVVVNGRERSADYLVIALGAELAPETVPLMTAVVAVGGAVLAGAGPVGLAALPQAATAKIRVSAESGRVMPGRRASGVPRDNHWNQACFRLVRIEMRPRPRTIFAVLVPTL